MGPRRFQNYCITSCHGKDHRWHRSKNTPKIQVKTKTPYWGRRLHMKATVQPAQTSLTSYYLCCNPLHVLHPNTNTLVYIISNSSSFYACSKLLDYDSDKKRYYSILSPGY